MSNERSVGDMEASDPDVTHWLLECGFLTAPVKFRLKGKSAEDLRVQIERLQRAYGDEVRITEQQHNRVGNEFIAYGAFLK